MLFLLGKFLISSELEVYHLPLQKINKFYCLKMATSSASANRAMYIGLGLGATMLSGAVTYLFYKYIKRDVMPLKWRRIGTLDQINLFPVKSCGPLPLKPEDELFCEFLGLRYRGVQDRILMLVNDKHEMVTARGYPKMVLINSKLLGETQLQFSYENMEVLTLDLDKLASAVPSTDVRTSVWGAKVDTMLCGEKYDRWFSKAILGKEEGLHLVYFPHLKPVRSINADMVKEPFIVKEDTGTFGDATSFMLMNLASVDDLNTRLARPINAMQFRGGFHLKMDESQPYAEDNWQWIRIGETAVFRVVAPCGRCIVPNINEVTGERDPEAEPLRTLKNNTKLRQNFQSPVH